MKTAIEMYDFCQKKQFGHGSSTKNWALKHFSIIENALSDDEEVIICFMGLHSHSLMNNKHNGNFAYAITKKECF